MLLSPTMARVLRCMCQCSGRIRRVGRYGGGIELVIVAGVGPNSPAIAWQTFYALLDRNFLRGIGPVGGRNRKGHREYPAHGVSAAGLRALERWEASRVPE